MSIVSYFKSKLKKDKCGTEDNPIPIYFHAVTRKENVAFQISVIVTKENKELVQEALAAVGSSFPAREGDTVRIDYSFVIDYLNGINKKFDTIMELLERKDTILESVSLSELNHGKVLIYEMLSRIDKIQRKLVKRVR